MLGRDALLALEFLDRAQRAWYCTKCWAEAVGVESGKLERLAVLLATEQALAAGYQAKVAGPCSVCDARGAEAQGWKGFGSVRSLGKARGDDHGGYASQSRRDVGAAVPRSP